MAAAVFPREERIGLTVAVLAHAGLLAFLLLRPSAGDVVMPPERIEVTLTDDVGLISTSPDPSTDAAADIAPTLGEGAIPEPVIADVLPFPVPPVAPSPEPRQEARSEPRPEPDARERRRPDRPTPAPRETPRPQPRAEPRAAPKAAPKASRPAAPAPRPAEKAGGSRVGSDFLEGVEGAQSTQQSSSPRAATIGPRVMSSLSGAISRQLKPHWAAPQGPEVEEIVTILAWNLNADGSLAGSPRVVRQDGVNDVNRAQAPRHAEQAIRAVQLAAPFDLPSEYYDGWKRVAAFRFDKRLSQ